MKKIILEFVRRGLAVCGFGPLVLAMLYLLLEKQGVIETLTAEQVSLGIVSLTALAFVAGGMNVVYQIERLPLMAAIFLHGGVLYGSYLLTYLANGWLEQSVTPILAFSGIFGLGYLVIWMVIYAVTKRRTARINEMLKQNQEG